MISTMSDNVDNFEAVNAMPPFALFPLVLRDPWRAGGGAGVVGEKSR